MKQVLATRAFEMSDQERFAQLSGDANPMHLDSVSARRQLFGAPVVHGLHLLFHALDAWLAVRPPLAAGGVALASLRGRFPNPALTGAAVETCLVLEEDGRVRLQSSSDGLCVFHADVTWEHVATYVPSPISPPPAHAIADEPEPLDLDEIDGRAGTLELWGDAHAVATEFPDLSRHISLRQIAELLATTRLVGMQCPGLHSIFSAFRLERRAPEACGDRLHYRVHRVLRGASLVQLDVETPGFTGRLDTFRRPTARPQPGFAEVRGRVGHREFADQTALVVGGSRGIGEATAKIVAAAGGLPIVTYRSGRAEAEALAAEIRVGGGRCEVMRCDALQPGALFGALDAKGLVPTHLYYFASPRIFVKKGGAYSRELYQRFAAIYVDGFAALLLGCRIRSDALVAFYPSTAALDERVPGLEEYTDAKAAGERLCHEFDEADPALRVHVARLPRIDTDQTASLVRVPAASATDVMLDKIRAQKGES